MYLLEIKSIKLRKQDHFCLVYEAITCSIKGTKLTKRTGMLQNKHTSIEKNMQPHLLQKLTEANYSDDH